ncbi:alpha/beta fold hydrolase [Nocardia sp. CDC153]|uniref:alpha/beta hydrolase n=1 Tax=Nocardia sp. CDC153 TaxID=3112167 RepID=UPI002DB64E38|nr:alpha/beta fold hydrolase [Nocardia sp. CDC153]MEC3952436.1 alpha/beta fold hydrolase [Nocardia sp. CDC153]
MPLRQRRGRRLSPEGRSVNQTHVVLIHGACFHMSSWDGWVEKFTSHGFAARVPGWPGEAATAARVRDNPGPLDNLGLGALLAHYERIVRSYEDPPVLVGHSVGGLIAQRLLGVGLGRAAVALAPWPVNGIPMGDTCDLAAGQQHSGLLFRAHFRNTVANAVDDEEAGRLFERFAFPIPARLLSDLGLDPTMVNTANRERGPLLLISGQEDRTVPDAVTRAVYKLYGDSPAVTTLKQFADRGHSLAFDSGWRSVADYVLTWLIANDIAAVTG